MAADGRSVLARRSLWAAALAVGYAGFAALRASDGRGPAWAGVPVGLGALLLGFRHLEQDDLEDGRIVGAARSAARAVLTGAIVAGVSLGAGAATTRDAGLAAGAALATLGGVVAAQRLPSEGGLLAPPRDGGGLVSGLVALGLAHAAALALAASTAFGVGTSVVAREGAATGASLFGGSLVVAACARALVGRRYELGVAERAAAALQIGVIALLAAIGAAALGIARPAVALPIGAVVAAAAAAVAAVTEEATRVRDAGRVGAALLCAAVPPAIGAAWIARVEPRAAAVGALTATLLAAAGGLAAPSIARRLAPAAARRESAIEAASAAALHPDPQQAIERALLALRDRAGARLAGAALYRVSPPEVLRVDRAGYVVTEPADVPPTLLALAETEPLGIARSEALRAAEVRRADLRPLAAWLADRHIGAAVVVHDEAGASALLTVPPAPRGGVLELEQARALRRLADRLGAAASAGAALARSLEREGDLRRASVAREAETELLRGAVQRGTRHLEATAALLARPARVASYGPAARGALERLERLGETSRAVTLLAPPGVDATAWAAVWHLASPRRASSLVVVDGVDASREDLAFWREPLTSPIDASSDGTLVVLDPQALPLDVQSFLGASADRLALVVVVPRTVSALVGEERLHERLADVLGDRAVAIPPLAARAEDLRGLVHEHLARAGVRLQGRPLAVDPGALAELVEHTWPGNDLELAATLTRAALAARGPTITRADLAAIGFHADGLRAIPARSAPAAPRGRRR